MPVIIGNMEVVETPPARGEAPRATADAGPPPPTLRVLEQRLRQDQLRRDRLRAH